MFLDLGLGVIIFLLVLMFVRDNPEGEKQKSMIQSIPLWAGLRRAAGNKQNWLSGL